MSKRQKDHAEKQHRYVHRLLTKWFPDCEVTYSGDKGVDHTVIYNNRTVWVETKSCEPFIIDKMDKRRMEESDRPIIYEKHRLGRFKFTREQVYPYEPLSQHDWLIEKKGWYILVVAANGMGGKGQKIVEGIPAHELPLSSKKNIKRMAWSTALHHCRPDWLEMLKAHVYNEGITRQTKIGLKGPARKMHAVWFKECDQVACPIVEHLLVNKH